MRSSGAVWAGLALGAAAMVVACSGGDAETAAQRPSIGGSAGASHDEPSSGGTGGLSDDDDGFGGHAAVGGLGGSAGDPSSDGGSAGDDGQGGSGLGIDAGLSTSGGSGGGGGSGGVKYDAAIVTFQPVSIQINSSNLKVYCKDGYNDFSGNFYVTYKNAGIATTAEIVGESAVAVMKKGTATGNASFHAWPYENIKLAADDDKTVQHNVGAGTTKSVYDPCSFCGGTMTLSLAWKLANGSIIKDSYGPEIIQCEK